MSISQNQLRWLFKLRGGLVYWGKGYKSTACVTGERVPCALHPIEVFEVPE